MQRFSNLAESFIISYICIYSSFNFPPLLRASHRGSCRAREAALESGPVMGTEQSEASASRMHDFRRTRKTERVRRVRRSRRENRNNRSKEPRRASSSPASITRRWIHQRTRRGAPHRGGSIVVVPSWGRAREGKRERGGGGGSEDRPGCRRTGARSSVSGTSRRRVETRGVLAWRVNDSVRLILQLQLEIAKMDEPVDRWEDAGSAARLIASSAIFRPTPSPSAPSTEIRNQGCHRRETFHLAFQASFFRSVRRLNVFPISDTRSNTRRR